MPQMNQNALRDPQIAPDAKSQVQWIYTGPTWARKVVHQCFMPRTHYNILRDPQITADAKKKFGVVFLGVILVGHEPGSPKHER
jgi:hypothetical protein